MEDMLGDIQASCNAQSITQSVVHYVKQTEEDIIRIIWPEIFEVDCTWCSMFQSNLQDFCDLLQLAKAQFVDSRQLYYSVLFKFRNALETLSASGDIDGIVVEKRLRAFDELKCPKLIGAITVCEGQS